MKTQERIEKYKDFEILQTLKENAREGDYDLTTEVLDIKFSKFNSFAYQSKEKKFELIAEGITDAKRAIDSHYKAKINPYESLGFEYVD